MGAEGLSAACMPPGRILGGGDEALLTWLLLLAAGGAGVAVAVWLEPERARQGRATASLAALLALGVVDALMLAGLGLSRAAWPQLAVGGLLAAVVAALGVARLGQRVHLAPLAFAAPCALGAALGLVDMARGVSGATALAWGWVGCTVGHALVALCDSVVGAALPRRSRG